MNKEETVYVVRLKDGAVIGIPAHTLEATLRQGFELVEQISTPKEEAPIDTNPFSCPLCDKSFKSDRGLNIHKKTHN